MLWSTHHLPFMRTKRLSTCLHPLSAYLHSECLRRVLQIKLCHPRIPRGCLFLQLGCVDLGRARLCFPRTPLSHGQGSNWRPGRFRSAVCAVITAFDIRPLGFLLFLLLLRTLLIMSNVTFVGEISDWEMLIHGSRDAYLGIRWAAV